MAKLSPMTLVLVVIVAVVLMAPQILEAFTGLIGKGWDTWKNLFSEDWLSSEDEYSGTGGMTLTIYYADGTTKNFEPDPSTLLPLVISDTGGEISKIVPKITVSISYQGEINKWEYEQAFLAHIKQGVTTKVSKFRDWPLTKTGTSWGTEEVMDSHTITATEIETAVSSFGTGEYSINFDLSVEMHVYFTDGSHYLRTATADATWNFQYDTGVPKGEIHSLSAYIAIGRFKP